MKQDTGFSFLMHLNLTILFRSRGSHDFIDPSAVQGLFFKERLGKGIEFFPVG
jgi:hypothetical protein